MNKNGLLICAPRSRYKNIGDYIQTVAQEQFWDHTDCYCEREALNEIVSEDNINIIMNGWFMWNPQNFPPASCINPLFISFHLVPTFEDAFFSEETTNYLKQHAPIGARDIGTQKLLQKHGISSYFSSCLTLTLGHKYKTNKKSGEVLFVDPIYDVSGTRENLFNLRLYLKTLYYILKYGKKVIPLIKNFQPEKRTIYTFISKKLNAFISACHFYASYIYAFDSQLLQKATVITHEVKSSDYPTNDDMMALAKKLINRYARAKLVVTSRIHCALPCLGVETPVIYVQADSLESINRRSPGRMEGLIELFNVFYYDGYVKLPKHTEKISLTTRITNSEKYKPYRDHLISKVRSFIAAMSQNTTNQQITPPSTYPLRNL